MGQQSFVEFEEVADELTLTFEDGAQVLLFGVHAEQLAGLFAI